MKRGAHWLAQPIEPLALQHERGATPYFDAVVVGSGYGGAVAAARLAALAEPGAGQPMRVGVLERGLEYPPGSFPARFADAVGHQRVSGAAAAAGQSMPEGLMDWRLGGDVWALVANGLGGGSLINAGVCEPADDEVLDRKDWPEPWRGHRERWAALYERARTGLRAQPWNGRDSGRQAAMAGLTQWLVDRGGAATRSASCRPVALSIVPEGQADHLGDGQRAAERACIGCGDCFTGCNVGAKLTLPHTYLGQAWRRGAALYCGATVRRVQPLRSTDADGARWSVRYVLTDPMRLPGGVQEFEIRARHVVLAAGTFGSTEILMRSRGADFSVSGRLGEGFSANGDLLSAYYGYSATEVRPSPDETEGLSDRKTGPTITTQIEWREPRGPDDRVGRRMVVQDLGVPGALGWVFREILTTMMVPQRWTRWQWRSQRPGDPDPYAVDEKAVARSLLTACYVDDGARGRLEASPAWGGALRDGALVVRWKGLGDVPSFRTAHDRLEAARPPWAYLLRNPLWQFMPKEQYLGLGQTSRRLLTVHPLGGCRMADSAHEGVVDPWGRVYDAGLDLSDRGDPATERLRRRHEGRAAQALHEGLYVLDGAIVPTALGINPLLTITALAEGAIDQWVEDNGWHAANAPLRALPPLVLPPAPPPPGGPPPARPAATAVRFGERMSGDMDRRFSAPVDAQGTPRLSMRLAFDAVPDLRAFIADPGRRAGLKAVFDVGLRRDAEPGNPRPPRDDPASPSVEATGTVWWFEVDPSGVGQRLWRSFWTWGRSRAGADAIESRHRGRSPFEGVWDKLRGASHFGAVRLLRYELELGEEWALGVLHDGKPLVLEAGTVLRGAKRVGYLRQQCPDPESANPWLQLIDLPLTAHPKSGKPIPLGVLRFDEMAMLDRHQLPLEVAGQADALSALRDLVSLGLYFGRTLFGLHMLSFRRPEYPAELFGPRGLQRLPPERYPVDDPRFAGIELSAHTVPVELQALLRRQGLETLIVRDGGSPGDSGEAGVVPETLRLRLTRLRDPAGVGQGDAAGCPPVLLIHGFGSGGIQFTHPAIRQPMATWLARRGFDVWVAELRTSIGLPTARRQWLMDDIAQEDIPALVHAVCEATGEAQIDVVAHCIGAAMFSMATLAGTLARADGSSRIRRAVLMQVGPQVELPRGSRARGYVAHRLQQVFGVAEVHSVASQDPDDAESLMDRLLGTQLYPTPKPGEAPQRPHYRLRPPRLCDWLRTVVGLVGAAKARDWLRINARRVNANRSAGIFGQLFQYENMNRELLDAMEDLLGSCNLTTYEQTAQYAFGHRITDQRGDDVYATTARLQAYFAFPTLLLHGADNRTFDPRTLARNEALLRDAGTPVTTALVAGHGHLDCVVGKAVDHKVYPLILGHLSARQPMEVPEPPDNGRADLVRLPPVGPWIGHVWRDGNGQLTVRIGVRLDKLSDRLLGLGWTWPCGPYGRAELPPDVKQHEQVVDIAIPSAAWASGEVWILLGAVHRAWPLNAGHLQVELRKKETELRRDAGRLGRKPAALAGLVLEKTWLDRQADPNPVDLGLVLGACRQRPLLVDRERADASLGHVLENLGAWQGPSGTAHAPLDAVLLCGDQIYGDSRADSTHPGATGARFFDAYREAWTAPNQRELMRRRPFYFALDDHEFRNDYNDRISRGRPEEYGHARRAWWRYQMQAGPRAASDQPGLAWGPLELRGFDLFLCDTRSERCDPPTLDRRRARIMGDWQMHALCRWLLARHRDPATAGRPKVVVMGAPVAPRRASAHEGPGTETSADAWERFPASLETLFGCIAGHGIEHVVFLSGDYHRHADLTLILQAPGRPVVTARSIVTSGLYCPYPFANAEADEWLMPPASLGLQAGAVRWGYRVDQSHGGSGYTRLTLAAALGGAVTADFVPV